MYLHLSDLKPTLLVVSAKFCIVLISVVRPRSMTHIIPPSPRCRDTVTQGPCDNTLTGVSPNSKPHTRTLTWKHATRSEDGSELTEGFLTVSETYHIACPGRSGGVGEMLARWPLAVILSLSLGVFPLARNEYGLA